MPVLVGRAAGACVFYDSSPAARNGRCRIHAALGHDALPLACRQFPRVSVVDPRGVSVTLSHYCPTAAAMIDGTDDPTPGGVIDIDLDVPAFPPDAEYVGLDARESLPPLVRRDLLMDWDAWWECERLAVALFNADGSAGTALASLRSAVADIQAWSPPDGPLIDRVRESFARTRAVHAFTDSARGSRLVDAVFAAIPAEFRPARLDIGTATREHATRRYLAAHAFANWSVHLGDGLSAWAGSVEAAWALLDAGAGVRQADLLLRHLVDPAELARALSDLTETRRKHGDTE